MRECKHSYTPIFDEEPPSGEDPFSNEPKSSIDPGSLKFLELYLQLRADSAIHEELYARYTATSAREDYVRWKRCSDRIFKVSNEIKARDLVLKKKLLGTLILLILLVAVCYFFWTRATRS